MRSLSVFIFLSFLHSVASTSWYVDVVHGTDKTCSSGGNSTSPFQSVQFAFTCVKDNDNVLIEPGTYEIVFDYFIFVSISVTVQSTQGPNVTFLDGKNCGGCSWWFLKGCKNFIVEGISFTNMDYQMQVIDTTDAIGNENIIMRNCIFTNPVESVSSLIINDAGGDHPVASIILDQCYAENLGGALSVDANEFINITNSNFYHCCVSEMTLWPIGKTTLNIINSTFTSQDFYTNQPWIYYTVAVAGGATVFIDNCTMQGGIGTIGCLNATAPASITIQNSIISKVKGSVLDIQGGKGMCSITVKNTQIINNGPAEAMKIPTINCLSSAKPQGSEVIIFDSVTITNNDGTKGGFSLCDASCSITYSGTNQIGNNTGSDDCNIGVY